MGKFSENLMELHKVYYLLKQNNSQEKNLVSLRNIVNHIGNNYSSYINFLSVFDYIRQTKYRQDFEKSFKTLFDMSSQGYFSKGVTAVKNKSLKVISITLFSLISSFPTFSNASSLVTKFPFDPIIIKKCEEKFGFQYKAEPSRNSNELDYFYIESQILMHRCISLLLYENKGNLNKFLIILKEYIKSVIPPKIELNQYFEANILDILVYDSHLTGTGIGILTENNNKIYLAFKGKIRIGTDEIPIEFNNYRVFERQ